MAGRQQKPEYSLKLLRDALNKDEKNLQFWQSVIDNPASDHLALRQAKGNLSGTQTRIDELKKVIETLDPPSLDKPEQA